jgi:hypothetical protein
MPRQRSLRKFLHERLVGADLSETREISWCLVSKSAVMPFIRILSQVW